MICLKHKWGLWHIENVNVGIPMHSISGNPLRKDETHVLARKCEKCDYRQMKYLKK